MSPIDAPLLSICIPTYNRSDLLARHLAELDKPGLLPFSFEVVVADNCSTDDTAAVLASAAPHSYPLRSIRNRRNTGIIPNLLNSLRQAAGEYCVYVADDDRLDMAALAHAVERMEATPGSVACYTGSHHRDLVTGDYLEAVGQLNDGAYTRETGGQLVDAIQRAYLFPEFALYRVSVLARTLFPSVTLFWPFPLIDRLLGQGSVLTTSRSFYHVIDRHPGETEPRDSGGAGLEQRVWASILDGMGFLSAKYRPAAPETPGQILDAAYFAYMGNQSFFSSLHRRRYAEAYEMASMLGARGLLLTHHGQAEWSNFLSHSALDHFQRAVETMGGIERIVCLGFEAQTFAELEKLLGQTAGDDRLPVAQASLFDPPASLAAAALLTASNAQRSVMIAKGQPAGRVFSLEDLLNVFALDQTRREP